MDFLHFQIIDSFIGGTLDLAWLWVLKTLLEVLFRDGVCLLSEYKGAKAKTFLSDARQPEVRAFSFRLKNETVVATTTINSNLHSCICNQKWIFYDTLRLYSARLKTFWIDHFRDIDIHTWLRGLREWNKRNVLLVAEPQDDFFCFTPPSLGAMYEF